MFGVHVRILSKAKQHLSRECYVSLDLYLSPINISSPNLLMDLCSKIKCLPNLISASSLLLSRLQSLQREQPFKLCNCRLNFSFILSTLNLIDHLCAYVILLCDHYANSYHPFVILFLFSKPSGTIYTLGKCLLAFLITNRSSKQNLFPRANSWVRHCLFIQLEKWHSL